MGCGSKGIASFTAADGSTFDDVMQPFTMLRSSRQCRALARQRLAALSTTATTSTRPVPWFVDQEQRRHAPPHLSPALGNDSRLSVPSVKVLPPGLPDYIVNLHSELERSPLLEPDTLVVRQPLPTAEGPPLPLQRPKGRRKRGGTYAGDGVSDTSKGLWRWIMIAQVKEGTENRGAIEAVVRVVRKNLLTANPPLPLPSNSKRPREDGWAMIDAGEFAVHVVSGKAKGNYFPEGMVRMWEW
ncbi:hypothetical protein BD410DRAFT_429693 [Rickenella mellea]|uniref:Uncharacterized protein n=1 Tax=Rickenella mellea TaxID=50990 RepID=A0A4Y7QK63_9AGAM|nr:hypothetical protein BD410DRAFT_429693 [Rickenella mellea]